MPRRSGLRRQSVRTQIKQSVEKSEFHREREARRQREQWEFEHAWRNRPLDERKRLLAATEDVQVAYDGAGYESWNAPEGGWRARGRVEQRNSRGIEVVLIEDLRVGAGITLPNVSPMFLSLYAAGHRMRFTNGGKHRDRPITTLICVPTGWLPEPWPGAPQE